MSQMTAHQALGLATQHHQAGRLAEAEAIYRQILTQQPNQPDALHLLGLVALQVGRPDVAIDLIGRAIGIAPNVADYHYNLGQSLTASGRPHDAASAYRRSLELRPDHTQAWNNLGSALHAVGQLEPAIAAFTKALELRPDYPQASYNLGIVLHAAGRPDDAIAAYQTALQKQPDFPEAWNNLGNALREKGRMDEAITAYRKTCELRPDHAEAHGNLGCLLNEMGQVDEGLAALRKALQLQPNSVAAHYNIGNVLRSMDQPDEALAEFRQACALKPDFADGYNAIGYTLREKGQVAQAISAYRQALSREPENARAHHNLATSLLVLGDFEQGWREYEWRFKANDPDALAARLPAPIWDGSELNGRTILIHAEQAFGDTIQFARYVSLVAHRRGSGGKIILYCHPELARLMKTLDGADEVVPRGDEQELPKFDTHCPLLSLPLVYGTNLQTIPASIPYLRADPELSRHWASHIEGKGLKAGLVWAGRQLLGAKRSIPPSALEPLAGVEGVKFISLQKSPPSAFSLQPSAFPLIDWTEELRDFADTAALIDNLDVVIAIDTAVAHLAGAMDKAVWVVLPFMPDWRWLLDRPDSPWYPTMRLFRQPRPGDWNTPIAQVAENLKELSQK